MCRRLMASLAVAAVAVLLVATPRGAFAADKKNSDQTVRSVQGTVTDANWTWRFPWCVDTLKVECPTGSGQMMNLKQVSQDLGRRVASVFLPDERGRAPWQGDMRIFQENPHWRNLVWFFEYFDGDNGRGCGASHQTGWTALITRLLEDKC